MKTSNLMARHNFFLDQTKNDLRACSEKRLQRELYMACIVILVILAGRTGDWSSCGLECLTKNNHSSLLDFANITAEGSTAG